MKKLLAVLLTIQILLSSCSSNESTQELVSFVENTDFGSPVPVFMENYSLSEIYSSGSWFKVTLYFGYTDNGNWETCIEDAKRLNLQFKNSTYRCVLAK
jgi:hypothetical protein